MSCCIDIWDFRSSPLDAADSFNQVVRVGPLLVRWHVQRIGYAVKSAILFLSCTMPLVNVFSLLSLYESSASLKHVHPVQ